MIMASLPRTCDRCYRIKARCTYFEESSICERCDRLRHQCTKDRAVLRAGRRPAWARTEIGKASKSVLDTNATSTMSQSAIGSPGNALLCISTAAATGSKNTLASESIGSTRLDPFSVAIRHFDELELRVLEFMLDEHRFIGRYVDGDFFKNSLRNTLICQLVAHPSLMKDGYLACGGAAFQKFCPEMAIEDADMSLRRGARALATLRAVQPTSAGQVSTVLVLALSVVTFSIQLVGLDTRHIVRAALRLANPWLDNRGNENWVSEDSNLICLLFYDTLECLVRREVPVIRFSVPAMDNIVDRYFGISHSILPILYDICCVGKQLKAPHQSRILLDDCYEQCITRLHDLLRQIDGWEPSIPNHVLPELDMILIKQINTQVHCFKLAAKIIISYYYAGIPGSSKVASNYHAFPSPSTSAREIMSTLDTLYQQTERVPRHCVFPLFLASVELGMPDPTFASKTGVEYRVHRSDLLDKLGIFTHGVSTATCTVLYDFACFIWDFYEQRSSPLVSSSNMLISQLEGFEINSWLDLVDYGPTFSVGL